jgi:TetR/AcrR family transcriptional repressor of nem operon
VFRERPRALVGEVAARAGVAKGTVYLYFASKDEMLEALREERMRDVLSWAQSRLERSGGDWEQRTAVMAEAAVELFWQEPDLHEAIFHAAGAARARDRAMSGFADFWERLVREGVATGALVCPDPELTTAALLQAAHGAVDHALEQGLDRSRPLACVVALVQAALRH